MGEVRPVTPTVKANCLEELDGLTDRVETPAMKAHSLGSQTLPTKEKTEKKKGKKSKIDIEDGEISKLEKGIRVVRSMYAQLMNEHGPPNDDNKEVEKETETDPADSMEVESSLSENSEAWDPTPNEHETLEDTSMDSTTEQGARSCVAQRTRSHTEEVRDRIEQARTLNMSKLNKIFTEIKDEEDRSRLDVSWEVNRNEANDSLALPAYKKLQNTIEVLEKSFKEMTA